LKLHNLVILFGTCIIGVAFFVALAFVKKEKPFYYNYIFAFILSGLLMSTNTIASNNYTWRDNLKIGIAIEQILSIFQSLMLGLFFIEILKKSEFVKKIKVLLFLSIIIQIAQIIVVHWANIEIRPRVITNSILLIFSFFYLKDLMNNKPTLVLLDLSTFWLVMGIFFSSCIGLPVNSLTPFIPQNQEYINIRSQIFSLFNMSVIVHYLFIIKSYLCLKHPQNL
jgi:hypothetical protein